MGTKFKAGLGKDCTGGSMGPSLKDRHKIACLRQAVDQRSDGRAIGRLGWAARTIDAPCDGGSVCGAGMAQDPEEEEDEWLEPPLLLELEPDEARMAAAVLPKPPFTTVPLAGALKPGW